MVHLIVTRYGPGAAVEYIIGTFLTKYTDIVFTPCEPVGWPRSPELPFTKHVSHEGDLSAVLKNGS